MKRIIQFSLIAIIIGVIFYEIPEKRPSGIFSAIMDEPENLKEGWNTVPYRGYKHSYAKYFVKDGKTTEREEYYYGQLVSASHYYKVNDRTATFIVDFDENGDPEEVLGCPHKPFKPLQEIVCGFRAPASIKKVNKKDDSWTVSIKVNGYTRYYAKYGSEGNKQFEYFIHDESYQKIAYDKLEKISYTVSAHRMGKGYDVTGYSSRGEYVLETSFTFEKPHKLLSYQTYDRNGVARPRSESEAKKIEEFILALTSDPHAL